MKFIFQLCKKFEPIDMSSKPLVEQLNDIKNAVEQLDDDLKEGKQRSEFVRFLELALLVCLPLDAANALFGMRSAWSREADRDTIENKLHISLPHKDPNINKRLMPLVERFLDDGADSLALKLLLHPLINNKGTIVPLDAMPIPQQAPPPSSQSYDMTATDGQVALILMICE